MKELSMLHISIVLLDIEPPAPEVQVVHLGRDSTISALRAPLKNLSPVSRAVQPKEEYNYITFNEYR